MHNGIILMFKVTSCMCVCQALVKKGIGHLSEKDLKERNKLIQEENRRELQKVQNTFYVQLCKHLYTK